MSDIARSQGDMPAMRAVSVLAGGAVPVLSAYLKLQAGFPLYFVTNLEHHYFLQEPKFLEFHAQDSLPSSMLLIRVNELMNAALEAIKWNPFPVTARATEIQTADEAEVVGLLRQGKFTRLGVERLGEGFRLEIEKFEARPDELDVSQLLGSGENQSITVKRHRGKVVSVRRTTSRRTQSAATGKNPTRQLTER